MYRKISAALAGSATLIASSIPVPATAAAYQVAGTGHAGPTPLFLFIPLAVLVMFTLLGGVIAISVLLYRFRNHLWPFDQHFFG